MKLIPALLTALAALATSVPALAQPLSVNINDKPIIFQGTQPQEVQGRVLVPIRGVFEKMSARVDWLPAERKVIVEDTNRHIELIEGATAATVDGASVDIDVPARNIGGRIMVPLRFIGESLGARVEWNQKTRTVEVYTGEAALPDPLAQEPPPVDPAVE